MSSYWALAGFSYLKYLNRATLVMRQAVKEPLRTKLMDQERLIVKKITIKPDGTESSEMINRIHKAADS
eukprot:CAMPEP_0197524446 /NCGR_PEP_ID=MMETSP1318-20131121/9123_1 /TAXON_ID=552666 /ORGANISM="Partenskyella glossopodia, Strain RCC365" /LENGTH=68 /DNA_ID=CAMNT_0043077407 /DNA_START=143 /DNA_END=349 /DNA_ORIENTATION=+